MRVTIQVALIHRRRAFQSGATRALMAMLPSWSQAASLAPDGEATG